MDKWIFKYHKQIGDIIFGMKRNDVRSLFDNKYTEFKKSKFSKTTTDDFSKCHIYYNENNVCEAVEIFNDSKIDIYMDNKKIFPINLSQLKEIFSDIEEENGSYISKSKSIGIYAPDGQVESILFGDETYYL